MWHNTRIGPRHRSAGDDLDIGGFEGQIDDVDGGFVTRGLVG